MSTSAKRTYLKMFAFTAVALMFLSSVYLVNGAEEDDGSQFTLNPQTVFSASHPSGYNEEVDTREYVVTVYDASANSTPNNSNDGYDGFIGIGLVLLAIFIAALAIGFLFYPPLIKIVFYVYLGGFVFFLFLMGIYMSTNASS